MISCLRWYWQLPGIEILKVLLIWLPIYFLMIGSCSVKINSSQRDMQFLHSTVALCWFWRNVDTRATQKSWNQAWPRCVASFYSQFFQCFFRSISRNWHHPWRPNNLCGYISQSHQMKSCLKQWKLLCANFIQSQGGSLCPGTNVAGGQFAVYFELWTPKCVSNCYNFYSVSNLHFFAILFWYCVCTL